MNYLDILNEDILNKIFENVADLYEKDIEKTKNKLSKVNSLVEGLNITVDADWGEVYYISYYFISYCMNKYLYSRYPLDNIVIVNRLKLILYYNIDENTHTPIVVKSDLLEKPLYLDILREINSIYEKQTEIFGYYDSLTVLENLREVKKNEYEYYNINTSCTTTNNYITFEYCS
jgi:hypothetical protein